MTSVNVICETKILKILIKMSTIVIRMTIKTNLSQN